MVPMFLDAFVHTVIRIHYTIASKRKLVFVELVYVKIFIVENRKDMLRRNATMLAWYGCETNSKSL